MVDRIHMKSQAAKHVDAYIEYNNIVGKADGGKMFTEKEYEAYKAKTREARQKLDFMSLADGQDVADMRDP